MKIHNTKETFMRSITANIPCSIGDIIFTKAHLDAIKNEYDEIKISFYTHYLYNIYLGQNSPENNLKWEEFLHSVGQLFFSEPPYSYVVGAPHSSHPFRMTPDLIDTFNCPPTKSELGHLLCKGNSLNLDSEYVVLTTKVRYLERSHFDSVSREFFDVINKLSQKYRIVILGEKVLEKNKDYINWTDQQIYCIYPEIIKNIPSDNLIDLSLSALGERALNLSQMQQDCLIMKEARCVITFGVGGNFCLSTATAKMAIGYRTDGLKCNDDIYENKEYDNAIVTKNWNHFIQTLLRYL